MRACSLLPGCSVTSPVKHKVGPGVLQEDHDICGDGSVCSSWEALCLLSLLSGTGAVSGKPHTLLNGMEVDTAIMEDELKVPAKPKGASTMTQLPHYELHPEGSQPACQTLVKGARAHAHTSQLRQSYQPCQPLGGGG